MQVAGVAADVKHQDRTVPAGSVILLLTASANRDKHEFPDGERSTSTVRPATSPLDSASTSAWAHPWPGWRPVALEEVLKRFPDWEVDWDNAKQAHASTVRGWDHLPVHTR